MGSAMILTLIALATISVQRLQRRALNDQTACLEAENNAQVAIRLAAQSLHGDAWRATAAHGYWEQGKGFGGGEYSIHAIDPIDGDFADDIRDPVIVTGVGSSGDATRKTRVTLVPSVQPLAALRAGVWCEEELEIEDATVHADQVIGSNKFVSSDSATISAPVESAGGVTGGSYQRTVSENMDARPLPTSDEVTMTYLPLASPIEYSSLSSTTERLLPDGGFESNFSGLYADDAECTIERSTSLPGSGNYSIHVSNRTSATASPAVDVTNWLTSEQHLTIFGFMLGTGFSGQINVELTYRARGQAPITLAARGPFAFPFWTPFLVSFRPDWEGPLDYAYVRIYCHSTDDFFLDDLDFRLTSTDGSFLFREVIGPGTHQSDTSDHDGVYVIDCDGKNLFIKNCRIQGTLILLDPGPKSAVAHGPLVWQPAIDNYPALLISSPDASRVFRIQCSRGALSEKQEGRNFNPNGVPFHGVFDSDETDVYPSSLRGIVFSDASLQISNAVRLEGAILARGHVEIKNGDLEVVPNDDLLRWPPEPFRLPTTYRILPDSIRSSLKILE